MKSQRLRSFYVSIVILIKFCCLFLRQYLYAHGAGLGAFQLLCSRDSAQAEQATSSYLILNALEGYWLRMSGLAWPFWHFLRPICFIAYFQIGLDISGAPEYLLDEEERSAFRFLKKSFKDERLADSLRPTQQGPLFIGHCIWALSFPFCGKFSKSTISK